MAEAEESPAQKAARLRRERRGAKIKADGSARLDRITGLSGRPKAHLSEESSPSPSARVSPTPPSGAADAEPQLQSPSPSEARQRSVSPRPQPHTPNLEDQSPENIKAQEEYLRTLLRAQAAGGQATPPGQTQEDPTAKLLSAFMGGGGMNPGASSSSPSSPSPGAAAQGAPPEISPADLTSALGVPSSLASFFTSQTQPDPPDEQAKNTRWKIAHLVFALAIASYILITFTSAIHMFGNEPPPPSTVWNPFVIFMTGEMVLVGMRVRRKIEDGQGRDVKLWVRVLGDLLRDCRIVIFVLGIWSVWPSGLSNEIMK